MSSDRPLATRDEVDEAVRQIRAYPKQGRQSLQHLPGRALYGASQIKELGDELDWADTRLRKARQFADPVEGYSRDRLNELCRLLREHRLVFGLSHVGVPVTVPWPQRGQIQRLCVETSGFSLQVGRGRGTRLRPTWLPPLTSLRSWAAPRTGSLT